MDIVSIDLGFVAGVAPNSLGKGFPPLSLSIMNWL